MKISACKTIMLVMISTVVIMISYPAISNATEENEVSGKLEDGTLSHNEINGLEVARVKLQSAIKNYKNGDIDAAKYDLDIAIEWLNRAKKNSKTEKTRASSQMLAIEINDFNQQLKESSAENENALLRFWHKSTAIIEREVDQLVQGYIELSTSEKTLKHLLDAKMHLYTAEHDLLVSHNAHDSKQELDSVIEYLDKAGQDANPPIKEKILFLSNKIILLKEQVSQNPDAWRNNDEIMLIKQAKESLAQAKVKVPSNLRLRIEAIEVDIQELQNEYEKNDIKQNYDSCMASLKEIISEL